MVTPAAPLSVAPEEFLRAIWGAGPGIAELTAIVPRGPIRSFPFTYPASLGSFVDAASRHNKDANVYMGVCLRREPWPRKNSRGEEEKRGTEENALSAGTVWAEMDFAGLGHKGKVVEAEVARKALAAFPLKPSVIVRSGGGIHVYWLLKEPATGGLLGRVKLVNVALAAHFGCDNVADLARILRIPGLMNVKYDPPRKVDVSWWKPANRYGLDDFNPVLPLEGLALPPAVPRKETAARPAASPEGPRTPPAIELTAEARDKIQKLFAEIWIEGWRHKLALYMGGVFAHAGISEESAKEIVAASSNSVGGETDRRLKDVEDTYRRYVGGIPIAGAPSVEKMLEEFPDILRDRAKKIWDIAKRLIPRKHRSSEGGDGSERRRSPEPDFDLVGQVIKFNSRPARWTTRMKLHSDGSEIEVTCETGTFESIRTFRVAALEQANVFIAAISQTRWETMISAAGIDEREAPKESRVDGAVETALEEFVSDRKENPEIGDLKSFAGYDEGNLYFRLPTFKGFLRDQGLRVEDRVITHYLKINGWESSVRRFGEKTSRVWTKTLPQNGHAKPDLFQEIQKPETPK